MTQLLSITSFMCTYIYIYLYCMWHNNKWICISVHMYIHVTPTHDTQYHYCLKDVCICHICSMFVSAGDSCGQPDSPTNGRVDTSAGTSFGDVARYSCNKGYTLIGLNETTCQADGRWNGSVPTCESKILKRDKVCFCECNHAYSIWAT